MSRSNALTREMVFRLRVRDLVFFFYLKETMVDCASSIGSFPHFDVRKDVGPKADWVLFNLHKWCFSPPGVALMY